MPGGHSCQTLSTKNGKLGRGGDASRGIGDLGVYALPMDRGECVGVTVTDKIIEHEMVVE
jgi:hypothetical protein